MSDSGASKIFGFAYKHPNDVEWRWSKNDPAFPAYSHYIVKPLYDTPATRATTPTAKIELVEALRRLVTTYKDFEDGDGEPCPDVAFAVAALSNIGEQ